MEMQQSTLNIIYLIVTIITFALWGYWIWAMRKYNLMLEALYKKYITDI